MAYVAQRIRKKLFWIACAEQRTPEKLLGILSQGYFKGAIILDNPSFLPQPFDNNIPGSGFIAGIAKFFLYGFGIINSCIKLIEVLKS